MQDNYSLRYLPLFKQELDLAVSYIAFQLNDLDAANSLLDNVEIAIKNRLNNPESYEPVKSKKTENIFITEFTLTTILSTMSY